jgi:hypothetical protein
MVLVCGSRSYFHVLLLVGESVCEHHVRTFVACFESEGFDLFYVEVNDMLEVEKALMRTRRQSHMNSTVECTQFICALVKSRIHRNVSNNR